MNPSATRSCKLWIDGVGCYLICFEDEISVGNARPQIQSTSRIGIVSDLSSQHASIYYQNESYSIRTLHTAKVDESPVKGDATQNDTTQSAMTLCHGSLVRLGEDVDLRFLLPSSLSQSAALKLESRHRFENGIDGVVLFRKTCLLGSGLQKHIDCRDWLSDVVLFTRGDHLFCKSMQGSISVNGEPHGREIQLINGAHLEGTDWSMRIENND